MQIKERVLFQLARLHEVELGDYAAAESFYRRLAAEVPTSQKAYFASLRADELARGQRLTVGPYTADFRPSSDL